MSRTTYSSPVWVEKANTPSPPVFTETLVKEVYFGKPNMKVKQLGKRRLGKVSGWNDFQCGGEK